MQYLVLGASGYIGSYLYNRLKSDGKKVWGTRYQNQNEDTYLHFNIIDDDIGCVLRHLNGEEATVFFCIGKANIDWCYKNYEQAYQINVLKTKELIHEMVSQGMHVIFFSTDCVFDGKDGNYTEKSKTHGINRYGAMKADMEQYLSQYEPEVCIYRISKVVGVERTKQNIFYEWECQANAGLIRCIKDNYLSFVSIEDLYQACLLAAERKLCGLYNIAADIAYSRAELAELFCRKLEITDVNILDYDIQEFGFKDFRPLNTSLNNQKFRRKTGYEFISMDHAIDHYIRRYYSVTCG